MQGARHHASPEVLDRRRSRSRGGLRRGLTSDPSGRRRRLEVPRPEQAQGDGEGDEHVAHRPRHHGRARHRGRREGPEAHVAHDRGCMWCAASCHSDSLGTRRLARSRCGARWRCRRSVPICSIQPPTKASRRGRRRSRRLRGSTGASPRRGRGSAGPSPRAGGAAGPGGVRGRVAAHEARDEEDSPAQEGRVRRQDRQQPSHFPRATDQRGTGFVHSASMTPEPISPARVSTVTSTDVITIRKFAT